MTSDVTASILFLCDSNVARYTHVVLYTMCSFQFCRVGGGNIFTRNTDNKACSCLGTVITFTVKNGSRFVVLQQFNMSGHTVVTGIQNTGQRKFMTLSQQMSNFMISLHLISRKSRANNWRFHWYFRNHMLAFFNYCVGTPYIKAIRQSCLCARHDGIWRYSSTQF